MSPAKSRPIPANPQLYARVKAEAKRKFNVYPSAYANGWLVKEYKRRGGKYKTSRSKSTSRSSRKYNSKSRKQKPKSGLSRWFNEKWIDVCKLPRKVPCGRSRVPRSKSKSKKSYPYCRPLYRVSSKTPKTFSELSKKEIRRRCSVKKKNPYKKVY